MIVYTSLHRCTKWGMNENLRPLKFKRDKGANLNLPTFKFPVFFWKKRLLLWWATSHGEACRKSAVCGCNQMRFLKSREVQLWQLTFPYHTRGPRKWMKMNNLEHFMFEVIRSVSTKTASVLPDFDMADHMQITISRSWWTSWRTSGDSWGEVSMEKCDTLTSWLGESEKVCRRWV
jgi:hypothetical protein